MNTAPVWDRSDILANGSITRRIVILLLFAGTLGMHGSLAADSGTAEDASIDVAGTKVVFASLEKSKQALRAQDSWLAATSPFQRAATMGMAFAQHKSANAPSQLNLQNFLETTALEWSHAERQRWRAAFTELAPRLAKLSLKNPPKQILLVLTDGRDSAGALYTRGHTIFIPRNPMLFYSDMEVAAHEYFHILTRAQPALADRLYELLGFMRVGELEWPPEWLDTRIANPDAYHHRHVMTLQRNGQTVHLMPLLVAHRHVLQPSENFFNVLDVRLLAVTPGLAGKPTRALRDNHGQLQWSRLQQSVDYLQRLGNNTSYAIHPEETAADNFAFLLSGRSVPNPDLLTRFENILKERH